MKNLKIWWIPQVHTKPFEVYVDSEEEAKKILDVLAEYNEFQYENYCKAGGLMQWNEESREWEHLWRA